jgi:hypothetical protein
VAVCIIIARRKILQMKTIPVFLTQEGFSPEAHLFKFKIDNVMKMKMNLIQPYHELHIYQMKSKEGH